MDTEKNGKIPLPIAVLAIVGVASFSFCLVVAVLVARDYLSSPDQLAKPTQTTSLDTERVEIMFMALESFLNQDPELDVSITYTFDGTEYNRSFNLLPSDLEVKQTDGTKIWSWKHVVESERDTWTRMSVINRNGGSVSCTIGIPTGEDTFLEIDSVITIDVDYASAYCSGYN